MARTRSSWAGLGPATRLGEVYCTRRCISLDLGDRVRKIRDGVRCQRGELACQGFTVETRAADGSRVTTVPPKQPRSVTLQMLQRSQSGPLHIYVFWHCQWMRLSLRTDLSTINWTCLVCADPVVSESRLLILSGFVIVILLQKGRGGVNGVA